MHSNKALNISVQKLKKKIIYFFIPDQLNLLNIYNENNIRNRIK
tara:strand:- start:203 stop:334 length:132 start_codon:yes stop_codon:yes gene_type:complete